MNQQNCCSVYWWVLKLDVRSEGGPKHDRSSLLTSKMPAMPQSHPAHESTKYYLLCGLKFSWRSLHSYYDAPFLLSFVFIWNLCLFAFQAQELCMTERFCCKWGTRLWPELPLKTCLSFPASQLMHRLRSYQSHPCAAVLSKPVRKNSILFIFLEIAPINFSFCNYS